ncbi:MAG TPA: (d)CMP kinase, partial [Candidatus Krumholzibacteria bacterium]|nr:(d)CMP kinase [Candidatus Krumholzibacteria bacterium]
MRVTSPADLPDRDPSLMPRHAVIAVDGPAGSGKSTTAKALADRFGLLYIDTGAMYRALTLAALRAGVGTGDEPALAAMLAGAELELRPGRGEVTVLWNGADVSQAIRTPEVDAAVSAVSAHAAVRADMVRRQQAFGRRGGVVMEGRDIGSVVFPLATSKIFLKASLEARVERRVRQFRQRGREVSAQDVARDLAERDRLDSERATSPLLVLPDAIVVDSSALSLEQQNEACARAALVNPALDRELDTDLQKARRRLPFQYRLAYACFGAAARFYGLRQVGLEGQCVPGGTIIACNHISLWDPPLLGSTLRRAPVRALAKEELFRPAWLLGRFFRWLDAIPIRRRGYDRAAFGEASRALDAGENLLIFPEGTRRAIGHPGPVKNGLGILVQATRAPLLPVFIRGSYGRQPGGSQLSPLEVRYGPVIRWHSLDLLLEEED